VYDLSILQEYGDLHQREATRLFRTTTVQDSLHQWLSLQRSCEWQLQKTRALFEFERREALAELQARLQKLAD
jgi:hypothetical protein